VNTRVLMIDNYDSFTFNLVQLMRETGAELTVARNDERTVEQCLALAPTHLVISPGPGHPRDAGLSMEIIGAFAGKVPILGVCLGHQAICELFGAPVKHAKHLMHGKPSRITHDGKGVYTGLPSDIEVGRYHSLAAFEHDLPATLIATSRSVDGELMGVRHADLPIEGVQFHPESVLTPMGKRMLENFLRC
jgi:anthranilate synthase/aminodeoxychorismate synthase-like glutamine amidotransferase